MGIYSTLYPNANVYNAGTVSTNNGTRTPVTKPNAGDSVVFISMNGLGNNFGGHWIVTCCIALSYDAALLTSVGSGTNPNVTSHNVNGTTYWIGLQVTNASWGGGTQIGNPLNVPVFDDLYICEVNSSPSTQRVTELIQTLGIVPDYTPSSSGGSVYIGNNSSLPYKVINMWTNIGNTYKVAKGWVGVANEPRLFWGPGDITLVYTMKEVREDTGYTDYWYEPGEKGCYIIMYWNSTITMDLLYPSSANILISGKVYDSYPFAHLHYYVMNLNSGDRVTFRVYGTTDSAARNRPMCFACIFKAKNVINNGISLYATRDVQDGTISYTVPNDGKRHIILGVVQGDYKSDNTNINTKKGLKIIRNIPNNLGRIIGCLYYGTYNNLPTINFSCSSWGRSQLVDLTIN